MHSIRLAVVLSLTTLLAPLAAQTLSGSVDAPSGAFGPAAIATLNVPCNQRQILLTAADLQLPAGAEIDALAAGSLPFPAGGPAAGFAGPLSLMFSVDRATQGQGAVAAQASGNGASGDVFAWSWNGAAASVQLFADQPCLPAQADVDALVWQPRFPVFFSLAPQSAAQLGVSPADVLWVRAPGQPPAVYLSQDELALASGDDIDALLIGPDGVLFSLTRNSPTALGADDVRGAGLFVNGPLPWATATQIGLLPDDDLNALTMVAPAPGPRYAHSPVIPGHPTVFAVDQIRPGEQAIIFVNFTGPTPYCVAGLCLDILPQLVLPPLPPADPLGSTSLTLPIPPSVPGGLELFSQAIVPNDPLLANWPVTPVVAGSIFCNWKWLQLTRNAAVNGYGVVVGGVVGTYRVVTAGVTLNGSLINGDYWVTVEYSYDGGPTKTIHQKFTFVNGVATIPTGELARQGAQMVVTKVGISYW